jgi:hypothetical protein
VLVAAPVPPLAGRTGLEAGQPQVLRTAVAVPALGDARRIGLLLVVSSAEDAPTTTERDVVKVLDADPRVAYR